MRPDVTIIVPMYNVEKYVRKCMESLIRQTYRNIEIWAVSDGSPDKSGRIVSEYASKDPRIRYIEKENGGYGSVLEYCIERINSEYFIICDPDDWLEENAVEVLLEAARKNDLDIMVGDKTLRYENQSEGYSDLNGGYFHIDMNRVYTEDAEMLVFLQASPHAKLYRLSIARGIKFPRNVQYTDFLLYAISLTKSKRVMAIENRLANYLIDRHGNSTMDKRPKAIGDHIVVWKSVYDGINENDKYIIYRLYTLIKLIVSVYYKNSVNLFKDEYIDGLYGIVDIIKKHKEDIKRDVTKTSAAKAELWMIIHSKASFNSYIRIRKALKK